jgi:MYXO-CTERM domain-containing protein
MLFAVISAALAGPRIVSVGEPFLLDGSGNWPRLFPQEDGTWSLVTANQSGLILTTLTAEFTRGLPPSRALIEDDTMIDHGWATCPDGTIFHIGMGTRESEQHTAVLRRFSADLTLLSETTLIDDDVRTIIVDQPAVCGETFRGFGYYDAHRDNPLDGYPAPEASIFALDGTDTPIGSYRIAETVNITGASLMERDGQLNVVTSNMPGDGSLRVITLDSSFAAVADRQVEVQDELTNVFWPQTTLNIGGDAFVVYIKQRRGEGWSGQFGDVYLAQFDADWNLVEQVPVYALGASYGGFQPGLALRDDQLVVTFSKADQTNEGVVVTLDLSAVDPDTGGDDTGGDTDTATDTAVDTDTDTAVDTDVDTDTPADTDTDPAADDTAGDSPGGSPDGGGCGCTSSPAPAIGWAAVLALALLRRRARA